MVLVHLCLMLDAMAVCDVIQQTKENVKTKFVFIVGLFYFCNL